MTREEFRDFQAALDKLVDLAVDNNKPSLPPNLDEAAKHYSEHTSFHWPNQVKPSYDAFIAGAEWQKRKMMEGAVAVEVVGEKRDLRLIDSTQRCLSDAKRGDWLKIIIVKEEEQ